MRGAGFDGAGRTADQAGLAVSPRAGTDIPSKTSAAMRTVANPPFAWEGVAARSLTRVVRWFGAVVGGFLRDRNVMGMTFSYARC